MIKRLFKFFDKKSVSSIEWDVRVTKLLSILSICISIGWVIYNYFKYFN